jgi:hypothetical protein
MTSSTENRSSAPSRRALLAGAIGGLGAWAAAAIGRASPVGAEGQTVMVGGEYPDATSVTKIQNSSNGTAVIWGATTDGTGIYGTSSAGYGVFGSSSSSYGVYGASGSGTAVYGNSISSYGVFGTSSSYIGVGGSSSSNLGVYGVSTSSRGVYGSSSSNTGVYGSSYATDQPATVGWSRGNSTGLLGNSSGIVGSLPAPKAKTGVYGYAAQDSLSRGVTGESPAGIGVYGISSSGYGGYFSGKVYTTKWYELTEVATPLAPSANRARLFARVNGSGKTQLCVRFQSGAVQVIKTEP